MQSPLTNLSNILKIVKESASSYEATLKKNEAATRAVLIDPVLRALGWDVANPFMVEVETVVQLGSNKLRADYALKANDNIAVVIEAKKLGEDLKSSYQQLVQYGFSVGIERLFLTDGILWEHFTSLSPANLAPAHTLDLRSDDLGQIAAYLVQELDAALISPDEEQIDVLADQVEQLQQEVANLRVLEKRLENFEKMAPDETSALSHATQNPRMSAVPWQPLEQLSDLTGKRIRPSRPRLPDGEEVSVNRWAQVLERFSY